MAELYTFNHSDITRLSNQVIDTFLTALIVEKLITQEQGDKFKEIQIVIIKRNMFSKFWHKLFKTDDGIYLQAVKLITKEVQNEEQDIDASII